MKTIGLCFFLILAAVIVATRFAKPDPAPVRVPAIVVGGFYAPEKAADPFKPHEFYAHVLAVKDGYVLSHIVTLDFKRLSHDTDSCEVGVFRIAYPNRVKATAEQEAMLP